MLIQCSTHLLASLLESDVLVLNPVETSEDTSTGETTEDVGTSTTEEGVEAILLHDLLGAVERVLVLSGTTDGHHHATTNGVEGVRKETREDGDTVSDGEVDGNVRLTILTNEHGGDGVVKTEVETTVNHDTNAGDDETTVKTSNTIGSDSLTVNIEEAVVLTLTTLTLNIGSKTSTSEIKRVDESKRKGTSSTTRGDVLGELSSIRIILRGGEHSLDGVLEGEVKSLGGEVTDNVSSVTSPESEGTLRLQGAGSAVNDTVVRTVETTGLDHLRLVLNHKLDTLNGGSNSLGDNSGATREHERLNEGKLVGGFKGLRHP